MRSICSLLGAGSEVPPTHILMANGLSVRARISPAISLICSAERLLAPKHPKPPALETAATSSTEDRPLPNGPCRIGYAMPSRLLMTVSHHMLFHQCSHTT